MSGGSSPRHSLSDWGICPLSPEYGLRWALFLQWDSLYLCLNCHTLWELLSWYFHWDFLPLFPIEVVSSVNILVVLLQFITMLIHLVGDSLVSLWLLLNTHWCAFIQRNHWYVPMVPFQKQIVIKTHVLKFWFFIVQRFHLYVHAGVHPLMNLD